MFGSAFGSAKNGASAYATLGVETGVQFASPHRLIVMLFDGALGQLSIGLNEMRAGNIAAKGRAINAHRSQVTSLVGDSAGPNVGTMLRRHCERPTEIYLFDA